MFKVTGGSELTGAFWLVLIYVRFLSKRLNMLK